MTKTTFATFAILTSDLACIERVLECDDSERDALAARYGARFVYLPMGGAVGDCVEVDDDGAARVRS